ncbi:hypothetical protein LINPERHAP1_LOCUS23817 [Linum perenne]
MTAERAPNPLPLSSNSDKPALPSSPLECCMCGDFGFSHELFHCQVCQFRSQHKYCSNLYPKAESYHACNWCLLQLDDKSQDSSNSSSSNGKDRQICRSSSDNITRRKVLDRGQLMIKSQSCNRTALQRESIVDGPVKKKQKSPERLPTRRRLIRSGELEEKLRRTKSDVMANNHKSNSNVEIGKERSQVVFRSKVRRYKLLDEVSS